jgi:hypothetical protein
LKSNVKYHYLWAVDPGALPCFTSTNGTPDSGTLILIVQDPAIAQDYTSQLCLTSYIDGSHDFDLNLYAGLNVKWAPVSSPALKTDAVLEVNNVKPGTYKYKYAIEPGCGPGGTGVFYIKVTNKINAASKTVKYCLEKLPASINANDILGVGISSLNWTSTAAGGFNTTTGILEISEFVKAKGNIVDGDSVTFTVGSGTPACGVAAGTTVTIQFVSNLN